MSQQQVTTIVVLAFESEKQAHEALLTAHGPESPDL